MTVALEDIDKLSKAVQDSGSSVFSNLIRLAQLDPGLHLRFANWSGVDFSDDDLRGFDFTGADLKDCRFDGALIEGARFDLAEVDRLGLMRARDWVQHVQSWTQPAERVADFTPSDLTVFSDTPFAPEMVVIPNGRFLMGSADDDESGYDHERPQHQVTIGCRFALGRYPVTAGEYRYVMEGGITDMPEPGFSEDRLPKTGISWRDASAFCEALSERTGQDYRLPSEAEWEYACRAGNLSQYPWGDRITPAQANYADSETRGPTEVGIYPANDWGLDDIVGNVWEWCADHWHKTYDNAPSDGAAWVADTSTGHRVMRGGSWFGDAQSARAAYRYRNAPEYRSEYVGFRCARVQA